MKLTSYVESYVRRIVNNKLSDARDKLRKDYNTLREQYSKDLAKILPKFDKEAEAVIKDANEKIAELLKKHGLYCLHGDNTNLIYVVASGGDLRPVKYRDAIDNQAKREHDLTEAFTGKTDEILAKLSLGADDEKLEELLAKLDF